jgi:hypothetical protein
LAPPDPARGPPPAGRNQGTDAPAIMKGSNAIRVLSPIMDASWTFAWQTLLCDLSGAGLASFT